MTLDTNVVHYLLQHPAAIKTVTIAPEWFSGKSCREFVEFMVTDPGPFQSFVDVQRRFQAAYPLAFEEADWQTFAQPCDNEQIFRDSVQAQHFWYEQGNTQMAAQAYFATPNAENLAALQAQSRLLLGLNEPPTPTQPITEHGATLAAELAQPQPLGIKTFANVDRVFNGGLRGGMLWTIGARPGVGKSAFALNLIEQAIKYTPNLTVDLFSLEMTAQDNYQRIVACETGVAAGKFTNPYQMSAAEKDKVRAGIEQLNRQQLYLHDKLLILPQIIKTIRAHAAKAAAGEYLAVIDYLQIISLERLAARTDRRLEIETITRELKLLTNEMGIPIILFSQLNRELEKRVDRTPQLADLRESGSIEQDSNTVSFLYPISNDEEHKAVRHLNLIFRKNRSGCLTELAFTFTPGQMRFTPQLVLDTPVAAGNGTVNMQQDVVPPTTRRN
ncbi:DnaB-like helicase C-terminal domain-containing protein [Loigolactobacillus coryniformis]|uniref:DNA helicase n=1 Tax=Loigolactobacillus coryniformis subsp. torquens DSM 20004 = KCTC 3535 TaxID=1423822 RepID=A0A2D1KP34_9LACO|nr:DnaB-like helicase C-terminal domain-containing protein [Loigolactobacillus coryniformis]ATO43915.1 DNA helicase [Loigolactobacillus coryniformis subsp. torquens DSM 20004 = KCTC 3535]KRK85281.1 replicative DNA helicase [Loigolactobacillus coryniformis subsp. torquens DSM 20004 = KCTC 3535]